MSAYHPVFLDLAGRPVVVVGGGSAAAGRVERFLECGARVTVIAAALTEPALARRAAAGDVDHRPRPYRRGDLEGAWLVVAEPLDGATADALFAEARERRVFACVEDDLEHASYIHPSVVRRGDLTVAVSTSGSAPALAVRLRQELEERLGPHHARFLELAAAVRRPLADRTPDVAERRRRWYRLVDSDVLDLLAADREAEARQRFAELLGVAPPAPAIPRHPPADPEPEELAS